MALISEVAAAIAEAEGIPEATVALAARYAREAGFLSQGARGRNAPHATITDCSNLLIAVNAGGCAVKDAPAAIESFRKLRTHAPHSVSRVSEERTVYGRIEADELRFLDRHGSTFGEVLDGIVERFVGGELERYLKTEAARFLPADFAAKALAELEGDTAAAAVKVRYYTESLLRFDKVVKFELRFGRPFPFAHLTIARSGGSVMEPLANVRFVVDANELVAGKLKISDGDRRDETAIGYHTFMKVAEVMRS